MRTKGLGIKKKIWFSICSVHQEYNKNCNLCNKGTWVPVWRYKISSLVYDIAPGLWRFFVNKWWKQ